MHLIGKGRHLGYEHLLEEFWADATRAGVDLPQATPVSPAAFTKARRKLKAESLHSLVVDAAGAFERDLGSHHRFRGRRVFAIDGTWISTQRSWALLDEFNKSSKGHVPQLMATVLYDVIAKTPIDAVITKFSSNERLQAVDLIERHVKPGDIVLLDRGFPSRELIARLRELKVDFVARVKTKSTLKCVEAFVQTGRLEAVVNLGTDEARSDVRILRRPAIRGKKLDPFVLLTSLSAVRFKSKTLFDLYRKRWEIELFFRLQKGSYLGHDQFHAKTPDGVRQEIYALFLFMILTRSAMATAAIEHGVLYERISQKRAIRAVMRELVLILRYSRLCDAQALLERLFEHITRRLNPIRVPRSCPRRSFKPQARWTPTGKLGQRAKK
jgi:hypothetical protein